jgi:hypothetical protein
VTFPSPGQGAVPEYIPFSTQPVTVARAETASATTTSAPSSNGASASGGGAAAAAADPQKKAQELEETYEYVLDRLRRDLLIEREQSGHLLIDNP